MSDIQNFNDTKLAFSTRSTQELIRAKFLFSMLGQAWLLPLAKPILSLSLKIGLPVGPLIKSTVFAHFCGGGKLMECMGGIDALYEKTEVKSTLGYSVESARGTARFDTPLT